MRAAGALGEGLSGVLDIGDFYGVEGAPGGRDDAVVDQVVLGVDVEILAGGIQAGGRIGSFNSINGFEVLGLLTPVPERRIIDQLADALIAVIGAGLVHGLVEIVLHRQAEKQGGLVVAVALIRNHVGDVAQVP